MRFPAIKKIGGNIEMKLPKALNVHGIRVLTTRQLAIMYGTEPGIINNNFTRNKTKYVLEKHYISVEGEEMKQLKTSHQFDGKLGLLTSFEKDK